LGRDKLLIDSDLPALLEGGPQLRLNGTYAKGFIGKPGVTVMLLKVPGKIERN
jgi:hypothetical protein